MIIKRLNRTAPEQIFAVFQASEAGIAANDAVVLDTSSSADGVRIKQAGPALETNLAVGLADAAIANSAYGLVQIYGYRSTARIEISGATLTAGSPMGVKNSTDVLSSKASVSPAYLPGFTLVQSVVSTATGTSEVSDKIFIRCM